MTKYRNKNIWNSSGWTIIAITSLLLLLFLTIFGRNKSFYNQSPKSTFGDYPLSKYINLFEPVKPASRAKKRYNGVKLDYNNLTGWDIDLRDKTPQSAKSPGYVSKSESECKNILERLFGIQFNKTRPDFLKNDVTGRNLELDLYNQELKLCVEINGKQHYEYIPYFHNNKEAFYNQRYRDEMKKTKCRENGINYLEIPYNIKLSDLEQYIISKCRDFGYSI